MRRAKSTSKQNLHQGKTLFCKFLNFIILLIIFCILSGCTTIKTVNLVHSGDVVKNSRESIIPFSLTGHPILIKAQLNNSQKEYTFIFDTGALSILRQEVAEELGLSEGIEVEAGGSGGNSKKIELFKLDQVTVGKMQVQNIAAGVTDFSEIFPPNIAGILGSNFFKHFKVTIDYQGKKITLSQDTNPVTLKDKEIKIPFQTDMKNGFAPQIDCVVDGKIKATAIIDTGAIGIAYLPLSMMKETNSFQEGFVLTADGNMIFGMFGTDEESIGVRIDEIKIGDLELVNIPSISHASEGGHVLLGNKFLGKFLVTLNYPAEEMILKPYGLPFETNIPSYGFGLTKKDGKTLVSGVWENSPAARIGMQPGDEIIKINSTEVDTLSLMEMIALGFSEDASTIEIEFINKEGRKKASINKEMLFPLLKQQSGQAVNKR